MATVARNNKKKNQNLLAKTRTNLVVKDAHPIRTGMFVVLVILLLLLGAGFAYTAFMADRIMPGVSVVGLDLGNMTRAGAEKDILERVQRYEAQDDHRVVLGQTTVRPSLQQLGVTMDIPATVAEAFAVGRTSALGRYFLFPFRRSVAIPLAVTVNDSTLRSYLDTLTVAFTKMVQEPALRLSEGIIVTAPGSDGQEVKFSTPHTETILAAVQELTPIQLSASLTTSRPRLSEQDLAEAKTIMTTMMSAPLQLTYGEKTFTVPKERLAEWIQYSFDATKIVNQSKEGITITLNKNGVADFLAELNAQVGVPPKPTFGYEAEVAGEYAYKNSQGTEIKAEPTLERMQIAAQEQAPRATELVIGPADPPVEMLKVDAPKPTGKVVSVDLTRQALFAHEDGTLKFWTRVSTGLKGYDTPTGEWKIYSKTAKQWMIGQGYALPNVKWVMAYNGDYTLHTAYWHTDFGIPKSHGCTNMAEADAHWLYNWAEVGTPVVIYKSGTT